MASSGKQRTTAAKLNREAKVRLKRQEKAARKVARKLAAASDSEADAVASASEAQDTDDSDEPEPEPEPRP